MPSRRQSYSLVPCRPKPGLLSCFAWKSEAVASESCASTTSSYVSLEDDVIGITLVNETLAQTKQDGGVMLGMVTVPKGCNMSAASFRNCLVTQLPALPASFCFLTKNKWPVLIHQEAGLQLKHIVDSEGLVRIQRFYDKPRIGVKTKQGAAIGFIFCDFTNCLSSVRNHIFDQLGQVVSPGETNPSYQFLDNNLWPVASEQEVHMSCLDILHTDSTISICSEVFSTEDVSPTFSSDECSTPPSAARAVVLRSGRRKNGGEGRHYNTVPILRTPTFRTGKDVDRHSVSIESGESHGRLHQMLISYVRAEAAQHALELKKALNAEGFSVYLDVHEIKTGIDWQDALNYAVSNCEMFVPLVTPRYGETQWTNREVKLADYLGKFIVPVSFLDYWPPPCLAIQFATTQFVPHDCAKKSDTDSDTANTQESVSPPKGASQSTSQLNHSGQEIDSKRASKDVMKTWDWRQIKAVAREIGERYRVQLRQLQARPLRLTRRPSNIESPFRRKPSSLRSRPIAGAINRVSATSFTLEKQEEQPLIVISSHPSQRDYAADLKDFVEKEGFEVWCSHEQDDDVQFKADDIRMIVGSQIQSSQEDGLIPSQLSSSSEDPSGESQLKRLIFQQKADDAAVVVFILSKDFAKSKTSQQQVFYCEHRKRMVPLKYDDFSMPGWMSMLIGTSTFEDSRCEGYRESLIARIRNYLDPDFDPAELNEAKINRDVGLLRKALPGGESMCVYVSGSTKFYCDRSEAICKTIGEHLSRLDFVTVVTGGFFGVGEAVAKSFLEARLKPCDSVWHILPRKDDKDCRHQARQNADRTFQRVPYGKTVFSGDSVRDRETIISRVIDVCLLIEGGPGAAHEAEQFAWNDRHVIPVRSTGGAAGGKFNVPEKIFEIPQGVSAEDWAVLDSKTATPAEIGAIVAKIVSCLRMTVKLCQEDHNASVKKRKRTSTKSKSVRNSMAGCKTFVLREKD